MRRASRDTSHKLAAQYASALDAYLSGEGEEALRSAYETGRDAITEGLGLLELARFHQDALSSLRLESLPTEERGRILEAASAVFAESLSAFEMVQRGFQDANQTLQRLNETLETRAAELARTNERLEREVLERQRVEEQRLGLEDQLRQAQKMEGIGTLAGGIAHDFNNLLNIMSAYGYLLGRSPLEASQRGHLTAIQTAVSRGTNLVRQLLAFARKSDTNLEPLDLNGVARELVQLLSETLPRSINVRMKLDPDLPRVLADLNQVQQALLNLCVNARDAMPSGGELCLQTSSVAGSSLQERPLEAAAEGYVCITVSDTGTGIEESIRDRIFEPFFTTKPKETGNGLGLAVVYGIIQRHLGAIEVESEKNRGTTFHLYFPLPTGPLPAALPDSARDATTGGCETILLVEDEALLLEAIRDVLCSEGYQVLTARDGVEAVDAFERHRERVDLVVADVGMPRLGGWEAFQKMRVSSPRMRALLVSGYLDPNLKAEMKSAGVRGFLQKPYTSERLLEKIREVLDDTATAATTRPARSGSPRFG